MSLAYVDPPAQPTSIAQALLAPPRRRRGGCAGGTRSPRFEIEDAAPIDGCHPAEVLFRVVLPVALPGLMATTLYAFVQAWNEFVFAYCFISRDELRTLTRV